MDNYYIPKNLDAPFKVIVFTIDELIVLLLPFVILVFIFNYPLIAMGVSVSAVYWIKKLKGNSGPRFLFHLAYWYLPPIINYKCIPPSYKKTYLG